MPRQSAPLREGLVAVGKRAALWLPFATLLAQTLVATVITILILRWQERVALGRNRPMK
ncbi:MAG: hypothetical protein ACO3NZ_02730 [Pirellulales bacterium]